MSSFRASPLQPMVDKLLRRSSFDGDTAEALMALPYRVTNLASISYLVREGDADQHCIVLLSGFVCRHKLAGCGARQILAVHMRGDVVGLQNNLLHIADHNVQALTAVEVAYIPHRAILDIATRHSAIALALWREMLVDGSISREWMLNVGRRTARQRICHLLCEIAIRQQDAGLNEGADYHWTMTQEQIGDATGLTPVHVNRTIQAIRKDGLIGGNRKRLNIDDLGRLQTAGDFSPAYLHRSLLAA